ncbi:MAG: YraN family protein [Desulfobacteraceae bacterium]
MTLSRRILGQAGEDLAVATLKRQGYKILERNYTTPLGEIDLIAQHQGALVFVEVKTRQSQAFGSAREAISRRKQTRLQRLAQYYLKQRRLTPRSMRFDVVAISVQGQDIKVEIIPHAFGG